MKKLISMMLMLCAIITFSACSSDDDGPSNPVSKSGGSIFCKDWFRSNCSGKWFRFWSDYLSPA